MLDITVEDCQNKFKNTVMMIDGCPKFVVNALDNTSFSVMDVRTNAPEIAYVNERNLKAPGRIGYVQINSGVVYCQRLAQRQYKAGLYRDNIQVKSVGEDQDYTMTFGQLHRELAKMIGPGWADALENTYPAFTVARRKAKQNKGIYAFDKQFAVDYKDKVWYKEYHVGDYKAGYVVFHDSAASLQCLMGDLE